MPYVRLTQKDLKEKPREQLLNFKRTKKFLVAIDTDGCVTDNMNGKQILIFHPHFMEFYGLWEIESYYREIAEYYNLFSEHRGCNRFIAIQLILHALYERKDVQDLVRTKNIKLPDLSLVEDFIDYAKKNNLGLGNQSLERYINEERPKTFGLYKLLGWSEAVNRTFPHISAEIPPFNGVEEAVKLIAQHADIIVVSQTPYDDLADYWEKYDLAEYISLIAGQEMGTKAQHIELAKKVGGYKDEEVLMIGDAIGDLKAVKSNNGLFYPVVPGEEEKSWQQFKDAFEKFIAHQYAGHFEEQLLQEFNAVLSQKEPWNQPGYDHIEHYRKYQNLRIQLYKKFNPTGRLLVI
ncbi:MAG: HAD hydrolase-like protein [Pseudothermotoga sp.]